MKPFSNPRTKRHTTFVVMLTWAFGLASGTPSDRLKRPANTRMPLPANESNANDAHAADAVVGHADAIAFDHDSDADAPKESWLVVCDYGSKAQINLQAGVDLIDRARAPLVVFAWNAPTPVAVEPSRFDDIHVRVVGLPQ